MNTKKINELPVLQQATAETNVLVEQGGTASRIPVSALGGGGSGADEKALIEKLAPAFKKTGSVVTCNPVEGYPLEVVSHLQNSDPDFLAGEKFEFKDDGTGSGNSYVQVYVPAGEYTLSMTATGRMMVSAYNEATEKWDSLGILPTDDDKAWEHWSDSLAFTHKGGMIRVVDEAYFDEISKATLKRTTAPTEFEFVILDHNGETISARLPEGTAGGTFNWTTGLLKRPVEKPNLIPVDLGVESNWGYDDELGLYNYTIADLPEGNYTIWADSSFELEAGGNSVMDGEVMEFTHRGGDFFMLAQNGGYGFVKLVEGFGRYATEQVQLAPHEIIGRAGKNTLSSSTGDTEVSGRADITAVIQDLYSKCNAEG